MYTVNTNPDLLGKMPFTANKNINTVDAFNKALKNIIDNTIMTDNSFVNEYLFDDDTQNEILESFFEYMSDTNTNVPVLDKAHKTIDDFAGIHVVDMDDMASVLGFHKDTSRIMSLDNGFTFMYNVSSIGDDASCLIASIVYFDEDMNLCIYVPTYGNTRIPGTTFTLGNDETYDGKFMDLLIKKHATYIASEKPKYDDYDIDDEEILFSYLAYKAEFGIENDGKNEWECYSWECDIVPNEDFILKDIESNVALK